MDVTAADVCDVYHSYGELADVVVAFEIETITKYKLHNKSKGFDEETHLEIYLSTINCEKTI